MVVNEPGVAAGTALADGLTTVEAIPQSHKVSRWTSGKCRGGALWRGHRLRPARPGGSWITEALLRMPEPPALDNLPKATAPGQVGEPLEGYTFEGFRNPDGSVGTRNILAVTTTVQCVVGVLILAWSGYARRILPRYPNVDDVVPLSHSYGCGVAINAPDAVIPIRTLHNISRNPNFGGQALVIGLGCEKPQASQLMPGDDLTAGQNEDDWLFRLQDSANGFAGMVEQIMGLIEARLEVLDQRRRETVPCPNWWWACSAAAATPSPASPPTGALGVAADLLVRGRRHRDVFREYRGARRHPPADPARAATPEVADALIREMDWYDRYLERGMADRSANTTLATRRAG